MAIPTTPASPSCVWARHPGPSGVMRRPPPPHPDDRSPRLHGHPAICAHVVYATPHIRTIFSLPASPSRRHSYVRAGGAVVGAALDGRRRSWKCASPGLRRGARRACGAGRAIRRPGPAGSACRATSPTGPSNERCRCSECRARFRAAIPSRRDRCGRLYYPLNGPASGQRVVHPVRGVTVAQRRPRVVGALGTRRTPGSAFRRDPARHLQTRLAQPTTWVRAQHRPPRSQRAPAVAAGRRDSPPRQRAGSWGRCVGHLPQRSHGARSFALW